MKMKPVVIAASYLLLSRRNGNGNKEEQLCKGSDA